MPWSIKENDGKYCVVKDADGSTEKCYASRDEAVKYQKALYASEPAMKKMEDVNTVLLEGTGPALVAVAITSKPHLSQRTPDDPRSKRIEVVEHDGRKLVKVPLIKKALFRHSKGDLLFDDKFIDRLISNFNNKVTDRPVYLDWRHGDQYGAIASLDPEDGGWIEKGSDNWLYAYGVPTVDNIEQLVRQWPHASVEFAPNYESNFVQKLSSDDLTEIGLEDLVIEESGPKVVKTVKLFDQPRDDLGRFASGRGGAGHAAAVGAGGGGIPGAVVGAIANKAGLDSKVAGYVGGFAGGGPLGVLGSHITQKSLEGGSGYAASVAKGLVVTTVAGVSIGLVSLGAISLAGGVKVTGDFPKEPVTVMNETVSIAGDDYAKISAVLQYYAKMPSRPNVLAINVGKMAIPGAIDGYLVLSAQEVDDLLSKYKLEVNMNILEDGTATLSADEVGQVQALQDKVVQLEAKLSELFPKPEPQLPEAYRVRLEELEATNRRLERERRDEKISMVLESARNYRDERGYGHSKVFLDLAEAALKLQSVEVDGATVKLESDKPGDVVGFYNNIIMTMLRKNPGTVPMAGKTQADDYRLESNGFNGHYTQAEWEKAQEDFWK